jgi:MFS family permease
LLLALRMPKGAAHASTAGAAETDAEARSLGEIARDSRFIIAVSAGVVSYGLMAFIMTAAPMAMVGCGHTVGEAALGIQWHVLAMFAPSFFTGRLITRFGKTQVTAAGLLLIAASGVLALAGLELLHFWGALVLLGVGWNFGFIGATALLTEVYRQENAAERAKVQAFNDFLMFGVVAVASFGSGSLLGSAGWNVINALMLPLIAAVLVLLAWGARVNREARRPV